MSDKRHDKVRHASFIDWANKVRHHVPFAYWLVYDAVTLPLLIWGWVALSVWFSLGVAMLAFSAFFDVTEAIVKWSLRRSSRTSG